MSILELATWKDPQNWREGPKALPLNRGIACSFLSSLFGWRDREREQLIGLFIAAREHVHVPALQPFELGYARCY
ncbi:hypothetical protein K1719_010498 [Acacia pycnantha]|nr:hypothetical protein K1719_010498 [Acacia pycnantha]